VGFSAAAFGGSAVIQHDDPMDTSGAAAAARRRRAGTRATRAGAGRAGPDGAEDGADDDGCPLPRPVRGFAVGSLLSVAAALPGWSWDSAGDEGRLGALLCSGGDEVGPAWGEAGARPLARGALLARAAEEASAPVSFAAAAAAAAAAGGSAGVVGLGSAAAPSPAATATAAAPVVVAARASASLDDGPLSEAAMALWPPPRKAEVVSDDVTVLRDFVPSDARDAIETAAASAAPSHGCLAGPGLGRVLTAALAIARPGAAAGPSPAPAAAAAGVAWTALAKGAPLIAAAGPPARGCLALVMVGRTADVEIRAQGAKRSRSLRLRPGDVVVVPAPALRGAPMIVRRLEKEASGPDALAVPTGATLAIW